MKKFSILREYLNKIYWFPYDENWFVNKQVGPHWNITLCYTNNRYSYSADNISENSIN